MKSLSTRYQLSVSTLLNAHHEGTLSHGTEGDCAVTLLLEGEKAWMDVINPTTGKIDHWTKYNQPRQFAKGLQLINDSSYSVEELITIEALFEGRVLDELGNLISSWDDETDPGGTLGLSAVLAGLEAIEISGQKEFLSQQAEVGVS